MPEVFTIGHWTCPEEAFLGALRAAGVDWIADVRAQPGSRRSPQFSRDAMPAWLSRAGVGYSHHPALTGRRRRQPVAASINGGWQNQSFHNYADHTLSDEYRTGLGQLEGLAEEHRVALMCGEPMPWRCHRSLIASTLVARGWEVWHLTVGAAPRRHELRAWGAQPRVVDAVVTYPAQA